jgi:flagellar protein FliJ
MGVRMAELRGFVLAIELATRQRDEFAKALARAQRTLSFAQTQMTQLQGYAGETDARWANASGTLVSVELMRHHYQFMDRLQQAIVLQVDAINHAHGQVDKANHDLLQAEFRLAGLAKVLEKRQTAAQLKQQRREQRVTDEYAGMQQARKRVSPMSGETL